MTSDRSYIPSENCLAAESPSCNWPFSRTPESKPENRLMSRVRMIRMKIRLQPGIAHSLSFQSPDLARRETFAVSSAGRHKLKRRPRENLFNCNVPIAPGGKFRDVPSSPPPPPHPRRSLGSPVNFAPPGCGITQVSKLREKNPHRPRSKCFKVFSHDRAGNVPPHSGWMASAGSLRKGAGIGPFRRRRTRAGAKILPTGQPMER